MASLSIPADELKGILKNVPDDEYINDLMELCEIGIISSRPIYLSLDDIKRIGFEQFK